VVDQERSSRLATVIWLEINVLFANRMDTEKRIVQSSRKNKQKEKASQPSEVNVASQMVILLTLLVFHSLLHCLFATQMLQSECWIHGLPTMFVLEGNDFLTLRSWTDVSGHE